MARHLDRNTVNNDDGMGLGEVMSGATTRFAFPYPTGTDRVADGDNAMQALAERVETVMGLATGKYWTKVRGSTPGTYTSGTWTTLHSVPLTGLPIGGVVFVWASTILSNDTASAQIQTRISSATATIDPNATAMANMPATLRATLASFAVVTATGAAPSIDIQGIANAGTSTVDPLSHVVVLRIN